MKKLISLLTIAFVATFAFADEPQYSGFRYIPEYTSKGELVTGDTTLRELGKIVYTEDRIVGERNVWGMRGFFVGLEAAAVVAQPTVTFKYSDNVVDDAKFSAQEGLQFTGEFGGRIGLNLNDKHRVYLGYRYQKEVNFDSINRVSYGGKDFVDYDVSVALNTHKVIFGYDYLWRSFNQNRAYVGAYVGYGRSFAKIEADQYAALDLFGMTTYTQAYNFSDSVKYNSGIFGVNLGHTFKIVKGHELEVGVRAEYAYSTPRSLDLNEEDYTTRVHNLSFGLFGTYTFNVDF